MKKFIQKHIIEGFTVGIAIGYIITLIVSLFIGDGNFYPVKPQLISAAGGELNAVILQSVLCGILGSVFSICSLIWDNDKWSIAKQTIIYFSVIFTTLFSISYFAYWMEHSIAGFITYLSIFILIFALVWIIQYLVLKKKIKKLNEKLNGSKEKN